MNESIGFGSIIKLASIILKPLNNWLTDLTIKTNDIRLGKDPYVGYYRTIHFKLGLKDKTFVLIEGIFDLKTGPFFLEL